MPYTIPLSPVPVAVALGSNQGHRAALITAAMQQIAADPANTRWQLSQLRETEPVGGPDDQPPFLNAAAIFHTTLSPLKLLQRLLEIERTLGRVRHPSERWGPRLIDLDLLLYGDRIIDEPDLSPPLLVPHPRMHQRLFVLEPLAELAPELIHPITGLTIAQLVEHVVVHPDPQPRP